MVTDFITSKLPNSFIVDTIPFFKKDLMWYTRKRHRKDSKRWVGGNGEIKIIHDLGKGGESTLTFRKNFILPRKTKCI